MRVMNTQNQRLRFVRSKLGRYTVSFSTDVHWPKQVTEQAGCGSRSVEWHHRSALRWGWDSYFCSTMGHKHEAASTASPREDLLYHLVWTFGFTHYIIHSRILLKQSHSRWACCASTRTWVCFLESMWKSGCGESRSFLDETHACPMAFHV